MPLGVTVNGGRERPGQPLAAGLEPDRDRRAAAADAAAAVTERPLLGTLGLDEVEIPGVRVRESLRLPTWLATATRGLDLRRNSVAVELQRTTDDFPFRPSAEHRQVRSGDRRSRGW